MEESITLADSEEVFDPPLVVPSDCGNVKTWVVEGGIGVVEGGIDSLMGEIDSLMGEIDSLMGEIDSLMGDIDSLMGEIDSLMGDIDSLMGEIDSLMGDIDALIGDSDSLMGDIDSLVGSLESGDIPSIALSSFRSAVFRCVPLTGESSELSERKSIDTTDMRDDRRMRGGDGSESNWAK